MDVKYVPTACYSGNDGQKFYQYTVIEEASRKRFIYAYQEQSSYSTIDFFKKANNISMAVLGWKSPNKKQIELGGR